MPIYRDSCGENGFETELTGYSVSIKMTDSDAPIIKAMEFFCSPAPSEFVDGKIAQMRVAMARRAESGDDLSLLIATFSQHLSQFPADVVTSVADHFMTTKTFFPTLAELLKLANERMAFRRAVLAAMQQTTDHLLPGSDLPKILRKAGIGEIDAHRWFRGCRISGSSLLVPKLFTRDWIETNYGHLLRRVLGDELQITVEDA